MHLCITFLLSAVVYSIGRISKSDLRTINFPDNIEGTEKLNGSLITEIEVDSESSCQPEYVDKERCQSYNFGTMEGDSGKLNSAKRLPFVRFANFIEDEHFIYRGIMVS